MPESPWYFLLVPAMVAAILIAISWWPAGARWVRIGAATAGVGFFFLSPGEGWILSAVLVAVAASVLIGTSSGFTARSRIVISAGAVLIVLTPFALRARSIVAKIDELRERHPLVSLRDRLAYESPPPAAPFDERSRWEKFHRQMNLFVEDDPESRNANEAFMRTFSLGQLHSDAHRAFAASPDFGVRRILRPSFVLIPLGPVAPRTLPDVPSAGSPSQVAKREGGEEKLEPAADSIAGMHREARRSFLAPEAFGYVQDLDHVAGFEPHAFRGPFQGILGEPSAPPEGYWWVTTLQLVSLLKHTPPQVYETEQLPDMSRLGDVPTRSLDEFESKAVAGLRSQEIVTEIGPNRIDMLGALRATKACLECHQGNEGTLLGAFRYVLTRYRPIAEPKPQL